MSSIILESGTLNTRAGYAGDQVPKVVVPTAEGQSRPVEKGEVCNWDDVEKLWLNVLTNKLGKNPQGQNVLILDSPTLNQAARKKMAEIMFENYNVNGFFVANTAVTSLYATGRMDGLVLDAGEGVIHAVPVHQGYAVSKGIVQLPFGGNYQSEYLKELLTKRGYNSLEPENLRDIKEKMSYVPLTFKTEETRSTEPGFEKTYQLPDGKDITLGSEMFKCTEILFDPSLGGKESRGVTNILSDALSQCSSEQQTLMKKNIVLGGGPTMSRGFPERLKKEMKKAVGGDVDVVSTPHRHHSAWLGGSIMANLDHFQTLWITSAMFQETGGAVVEDKCK